MLETNQAKNSRSIHEQVHPIITANITLDPRYDHFFVDASAGPIVITLEDAQYNLRAKYIKKVDNTGNTVTIAPAATDTIEDYDGTGSATLRCPDDSISIKADSATNWKVVSDYKKRHSVYTGTDNPNTTAPTQFPKVGDLYTQTYNAGTDTVTYAAAPDADHPYQSAITLDGTDKEGEIYFVYNGTTWAYNGMTPVAFSMKYAENRIPAGNTDWDLMLGNHLRWRITQNLPNFNISAAAPTGYKWVMQYVPSAKFSWFDGLVSMPGSQSSRLRTRINGSESDMDGLELANLWDRQMAGLDSYLSNHRLHHMYYVNANQGANDVEFFGEIWQEDQLENGEIPALITIRYSYSGKVFLVKN